MNIEFKVEQVFKADIYVNGQRHTYAIGSSPEEAKSKAQEFINNEIERQRKLYRAPETDGDGEATPAPVMSGRGQCFVGKVWVANRQTKQIRRVTTQEADIMLSQGWVKAGPRTKL